MIESFQNNIVLSLNVCLYGRILYRKEISLFFTQNFWVWMEPNSLSIMPLMTGCFKVLPTLPRNSLGYSSKQKLKSVMYGNGLINYLLHLSRNIIRLNYIVFLNSNLPWLFFRWCEVNGSSKKRDRHRNQALGCAAFSKVIFKIPRWMASRIICKVWRSGFFYPVGRFQYQW